MTNKLAFGSAGKKQGFTNRTRNSGKKALGSAVAGLALVLLIAIAYYSIQLHSEKTQVTGNGIKTFSDYAELEKYIKDSSQNYGLSGGGVMRAQTMDASVGAVPPTAAKSAQESGSNDYSKTNIQVEGVDEADIVKNDGKYIYAVSQGTVSIVDAYPAEGAKLVSAIKFNGTVNDIFINGNKLVLFGQKLESRPEPVPLASSGGVADEKMLAISQYPTMYSSKSTVAIYDITDKSNPVVSGEITVDGNYFDSRMIGNYVYVIANEAAYYVQGKNISVPELTYNGAPLSRLISDVYYFDGVPGDVFTTIAAINLDNPSDVTSKVLLTNYAQNMYVSEKNIYIVYTKWASEADYLSQMIGIIRPLVPSDIQGKIDNVMALDISNQTKMQAISEILTKYAATLSQSERDALESQASQKMQELMAQIAREREKTVVQKISIDGGAIEYKTNAEVPGNTLNQFSMDEYNGYFRIATTTSGNGGFVSTGVGIASLGVMSAAAQKTIAVGEAQASGSAPAPAIDNAVAAQTQATPQNTGADLNDMRKSDAATPEEPAQIMPEPRPPMPPVRMSESKNNVYVLDENMNIVGKLEDLASGERIYSVRFMGDRAYMVTFRQTDPLFVIDLSVPDSPKVLGDLKIPGVSDYLHPYDETHIIGVGQDATDEGRVKGLKLALFDVSDVANPKEISKYIIGEQGTSSDALYDHKAFLFSKEKNLLVIPVSEYHYSVMGAPEMKPWTQNYWQGAYVFNIDLVNGIALKGKVTHANETASKEDNYNYDYLSQIRRSLYIDNVLYTISEKMVKMNALDTLNEITKVNLPFEEPKYYGGIAY